ncbi:hypothetical protein QWY92_20170 [Algibacter miyuki]|uniref:hypothetical protein n=1 Tax=Algibacter miyuki TaxID=1306933 RepID=UPI0025B50AD1|nr:hypothetical protein [Algibacter miyuki]MDN3667691.1 hypothetical protein [Algibacter miyuki]
MHTAFTLLLKYNGKHKIITLLAPIPTTILFTKKTTTDAYNWLDASIKKSFYNNQFQATLGGRNLLDITRVNVSQTTGGVHSSNGDGLLLGYGRSFYLKLLYNLNF